MTTPYDDIIDHPHHVSRNHPHMSMRDRAAQFSPFAALSGYADAICETTRQTEQRRELDEQEQTELNRRLALLESKLTEHPEVSITYFVPDSRKAGGSYVTVSGMATKISAVERAIVMLDGQRIPIDDIASIDGEILAELEM